MQVVEKAVGAPFQYGHIECFPPEQKFWLAETPHPTRILIPPSSCLTGLHPTGRSPRC